VTQREDAHIIKNTPLPKGAFTDRKDIGFKSRSREHETGRFGSACKAAKNTLAQ